MESQPSTKLLSLDFIAGIIAVNGSFMWVKDHNTRRPVFQLKMQSEYENLFYKIKESLGLTEKIYKYKYKTKETVCLLIRNKKTIENVLIPLLDSRLTVGIQSKEYEEWLKPFLNKTKVFKPKKLKARKKSVSTTSSNVNIEINYYLTVAVLMNNKFIINN